MAELKVIVFHVEHGFCAFVRSPNGYGLLIDCGCTDTFSPIEYLLKKEASSLMALKGKRLAKLTISHPHDDHIQDIERLIKKFPPAILYRKKNYNWDSLKQPGKEELYENLDMYANWQQTYSQPATDPDWGTTLIPADKQSLSISIERALQISETDYVNNLSIPVFVEYLGKKIVFPGDLVESGWKKLLKNQDFRDALKGTSVFVTSHHGHSSGYCKEIFEVMGKPWVNIVATHRRDPNVEQAYSVEENAKGFEYQGEHRRMLSTRRDGSVFISVRDDGWSIWTEKLQDNL